MLPPGLDELLGSWAIRFRWVDQSENTPHQKLIFHRLDEAMEKRYRTQGGTIWPRP
jgi:hypothetical protein